MKQLFIAAFLFLASFSSQADLSNYKKTKMENRTQVDSSNCKDEFKKRCISNCSSGDSNCLNQCNDQNAENACNKRDERHTAKTWEVIGKAATVGAGAAAVALDKPMPTVILDENSKDEISPYAIIWNKPSFNIAAGVGAIEAGAKIANTTLQYRSNTFGFGLGADYLWDKKDYISDIDMGPTISFASASFIFTLQPSLLITMGNGEKTIYGGGIRSYTKLLMGSIFLFFNPEIGYINSKWAYDLKVGGGYRFNPNTFIDMGYTYRDVIDFKDFDISKASLQGFLIRLGMNFN